MIFPYQSSKCFIFPTDQYPVQFLPAPYMAVGEWEFELPIPEIGKFSYLLDFVGNPLATFPGATNFQVIVGPLEGPDFRLPLPDWNSAIFKTAATHWQGEIKGMEITFDLKLEGPNANQALVWKEAVNLYLESDPENPELWRGMLCLNVNLFTEHIFLQNPEKEALNLFSISFSEYAAGNRAKLNVFLRNLQKSLGTEFSHWDSEITEGIEKNGFSDGAEMLEKYLPQD